MNRAGLASVIFFVFVFFFSLLMKWILVGSAFAVGDFVITAVGSAIGALLYYVIIRRRPTNSGK